MGKSDKALAGQHVVIVGGSSGMGLALAGQAAEAGARLTLMARDPDKLRAAAETAGGARTRTIDLRRAETVEAAAKGLGVVDHLVITAGDSRRATLAESGPDDWRGVLEERLIGPMLLIKHMAPDLISSIVLFSGTVSRKLLPGATWGTIALAGVEASVRALALELAPIRVNAVIPGAIDTPLLARVLGPGREQATAAMAARLPVRRIGRPEDTAQTAMLLMTNPFITGETILVDGGAVLGQA